MKTYRKLSKLKTFKNRFDYLRFMGVVGENTFGFNRYLNQNLYRSSLWRNTRDLIIIRDEGCDLGVSGYEIPDQIFVHHINPLSMEDIEEGNEIIFNLNNLICSSRRTHRAIHFGDASLLPKPLVVRQPGDTTLWR